MCYAGFSDVKGKGTVCKAEGMILHHLQHKYHTLMFKVFLILKLSLMFKTLSLSKRFKIFSSGMTTVFFTTGHEIRQIILDRKEYSGTVNSGQYLGGIDVDMSRKLIYWTDTSMKKIRRAGIPRNMKTDSETVPQDLNIMTYQPEDVAIDWVAR